MSKEVSAEALEKAADMLESGQVEWIQGDFETLVNGDTGLMGHCAVGALCKAAKETWRRNHPIATEALGYVKPHVFDSVYDLARKEATIPSILPTKENWDAESAMLMFNDRVARDKEEIIEVFKRAAKDIRNQA